MADEKWSQNLTSKTRNEKDSSLLGCDTVLIGDSSWHFTGVWFIIRVKHLHTASHPSSH
jgi:hypothetical protein